VKFKPGQRVLINKDAFLEPGMGRAASKLSPPYVATVSHIEPDPHSGSYMYRFKECSWGWYEHEVEGIYEEEVFEPIENRWSILDL
jgi:hypothetical protein